MNQEQSHGKRRRPTDEMPWGILPEYRNSSKKVCRTSPETRKALIRAMGVTDDTPSTAVGPEIRVIGLGQTMAIDRPGELVLEDGTTLPVSESLPLDLPPGYHDLHLTNQTHPVWIIKRPDGCFLDPTMRIWGWAVQLYAARSSQSWGIGDLADLRRLGRWSKRLGTGALLINPLSAVAPVETQQPSPYFPSSRRFLNPLYLRIEQVPGATDSGVELERLAQQTQTLNEQRMIDRDRAFQLKMQALDMLWARKRQNSVFDAFRREGGESLQTFATFCALAEQFGGNWREWPEEYRRPDSPQVRQFAEAKQERVGFHAWLQWLLDEQMARAACELPLVQDLPIGVDPGGADAWQWQDVLANGASVGAPPDEFNTEGQDWCLPPFVPHRLRELRFGPFIDTLRASLRHAGGLRIDHVMGLFRLYWIPGGLGPKRGAYVQYPADELLAIVAVESHRAGAWIAGEDLGTVERDVRRRLTENRVLSYRLLWFEDKTPDKYPTTSMAAITTHDLPTVAGLWSGYDMETRRRIGLAADEKGYAKIRKRLLAATELSDDDSASDAIHRAYEALARAPSSVLVANLDDALAVSERPNMPGTVDEWPNWSLALPATLEEIEEAALPAAIAKCLSRKE